MTDSSYYADTIRPTLSAADTQASLLESPGAALLRTYAAPALLELEETDALEERHACSSECHYRVRTVRFVNGQRVDISACTDKEARALAASMMGHTHPVPADCAPRDFYCGDCGRETTRMVGIYVQCHACAIAAGTMLERRARARD